MHSVLGKWTMEGLERITAEASRITDAGLRIEFLSEQFLGTGYAESTLIGNAEEAETLVLNLKEVDCFTFIDYVEAMRLSVSFPEFTENLKKVRYTGGHVAFESRHHFFTDWPESRSGNIDDVTSMLGGERAVTVVRTLNRRRDGSSFVPGISPKQREITYIPGNCIDAQILEKMETGDYAGIYSELDGLDVSHVGIIIKRDDSVFLRHASSSADKRRVVDEDLLTYLSGKPGFVILRPKG
ncbi:MAG: DUF1460 domain-containing protein [Nitrospirae bacterium]|nr:DUF1460 domain-containing protein [Nitrospirota bacterium]